LLGENRSLAGLKSSDNLALDPGSRARNRRKL
jgi:hypothetical protein